MKNSIVMYLDIPFNNRYENYELILLYLNAKKK